MTELFKVWQIPFWISMALGSVFNASPHTSWALTDLSADASLVLIGALSLAATFPQILSDRAALVGVGHGTDLLLHGLIVVFMANVLAAARKGRAQDRQMAQLAQGIVGQNSDYPREVRGGSDETSP